MSNKLASGRKPFAWIALVAIFSLVFGGISSAAPSWAEEGEGSPSPSSPQSSVESQAPQAPESTQASEPESKDQPSQTTEKQAPSSLKATPTQKVESSKAQKPQASSSPKTTKAKGEPKKSQAPPTKSSTKRSQMPQVRTPVQPEPLQVWSTDKRCDGVYVREDAVPYVWNDSIQQWTLDEGAIYPVGEWTLQRALEPLEMKELGCPAPSQPEAMVAYSDWQDGDKSCETKTVTQTRTKTTTPYKWDEEAYEWVLGDPANTTENQTRPMTAEEIAACEVIPPGQYRLETSHTQTCGSVTITLRNVSPWIYPVSYSTDGSEPNASGPNYGPVVDNRTNGTVNGPAKDQTGSKTLTFTEDQGGGQVTVKYVVAAGTESDLYRGKPVGTVTTVLVNTNCQPDPVPVKPVGVTKIELCEPASGPTPDSVVLSEDPNFTYKNKATGEQLETGFNRVEGTSLTIVAVPKAGVIVKEGAQTEWTFEFTKDKCAQDDVYAPEGSVSVSCADGSAVLDNRKSTVEVVYQLVRNGKSSYHAVPAGEIRTVEFTGGEGIKVALWALDALLDEAASPAKCSTTPPTTPPTPPTTTPPTPPTTTPPTPPTTTPPTPPTTTPPTPPTDNRRPNNRPPTTGGASDDSSLALGALASGVFLAIGVALVATRRRK